MSFVDACIKDSLPIWEDCLRSAFLQELAAGTLAEDCFKGYIVDDSLYLREYAKAFAWGMTKAPDMETLRTYYSLLSFVNAGEGTTRVTYLQHFGLTDKAIQHLPQRSANRAYTEYMIRAVQAGEGAAECMMAVLPCMLSYGWIFQQIAAHCPAVQEGIYRPFVQDYIGQRYQRLCREWTAFADKACQSLPPQRQQHCMDIFRECSRHELRFWEMCRQPRNDV